ncbi:MAG: FtsH protease activity modulator HflK [Chloroflexi bacterium]|nr:FtsH protease activity modulator HflK [Chloroflexota bacterium]MQG55357.1 FtsH protease activity modulator HflK [SAR202 cluster bacterium]
MYQPGGGPRQPELDFEKIMGNVRDGIGRVAQRLGGGGVGLAVALFVGLIVVIWAATGIYTTSPGEQAVLRLFGEAQTAPVTENGLHWWWPGPIGNKDIIRTDLVRRLELGFRGGDGVADTPVPVEAQMISGDLNIIDVQMVVQYDIKDLSSYLFRVDDPGEDAGFSRNIAPGRPDGRTLKDATEAALRLVVGQRSLAEVLAEERVNLEQDTKVKLQEILDGYQTGLNIVSVELQRVEAPGEVQAAFNDVLQARQDKVTATNQAQAYENQVIPEARGRAEQIIQPAEAFKRARIERAQGEADQFLAILAQFNDRSVTLENVLQDTDNADGDDDSTTGIGLSDVAMISAPDEDGDGFDILVSAITVLGAGECAFTANQVLSTDATETCNFSASFAAQHGDLTIGETFSIAYLGNEDLAIPQFVGAGPFSVRLGNKAMDADNLDGDDDLSTGVSFLDISVVDGPDGGSVSGVDVSVSGFDPSTNIVTLRVQSGEDLQAGDQFTVQYMNRENLAVPATSLVTQERLFLEAMEDILPGINKVIVSPEAESVLILGGGGDGIVPVPFGPAAP